MSSRIRSGPETTQTTTPFAPTNPILNNLIAAVPGTFSGPSVAPLTDLQQQGITGLAEAAPGVGATGEAAADFTGGLLGSAETGIDTLTNIAEGGLVASNPVLLEALARQRGDIESSVLGRFELAGRGGANQAVARTLADRLAQAELPLIASDIATQQARQAAAANQLLGGGLSGVGLTPTIQAAQTAPAELFLRAGGIEQAQRQAELDAPRRALLQQLAAVSPIGSRFGTTTGTTERVEPGLLQQAAGLGATAVGLASRFS